MAHRVLQGPTQVKVLGLVLAAGLLTVSWMVQLAGATEPAAAVTTAEHPNATLRIGDDDPYRTAVAMSKQRFAAGAAGHVVLASGERWPDALAGSALLDRGPLLLATRTRLPDTSAEELARVLPRGGTVYVLGGDAALGPAVVEQVTAAGGNVRRLAGASRVETAIAIADEVRRLRGPAASVALARADAPATNDSAGWADSISVGGWAAATGTPLLLTPGGGLHPAVTGWMERHAVDRTVLLGGHSALSDAVERSAPTPQRLAGATRGETAVAVAEQLWGPGATVVVLVNGWAEDGWAFGLPAAGLAADHRAPVLLVARDRLPADARRVLARCPAPQVVIVGGAGQVGPEVEDGLNGRCSAPPAVVPSGTVGLATPGGLWNLGEIVAIEQRIGARAGIVMHFEHWALTTPDPEPLRAVAARGAVPMITWEPWHPAAGADQAAYSLARIAAGDHDAYIRRSAELLASHDGPVLLRFAHEMNGDWYPWGGAVNGNRPADYVAAWRHVHGIFTEVGADNVSWVWSPNIDYPGAVPLESLYPGDAYVDWVGASGYNGGSALPWGGWRSFDDLFGDTLDRIARLAPGKPLMIAEVASTEQGGDKAAWITDFFASLDRRTDVDAFVWFHFNKETDWRIDSSPAAADAFARGVASSRYGG